MKEIAAGEVEWERIEPEILEEDASFERTEASAEDVE